VVQVCVEPGFVVISQPCAAMKQRNCTCVCGLLQQLPQTHAGVSAITDIACWRHNAPEMAIGSVIISASSSIKHNQRLCVLNVMTAFMCVGLCILHISLLAACSM
jgi:hypothetical protein